MEEAQHEQKCNMFFCIIFCMCFLCNYHYLQFLTYCIHLNCLKFLGMVVASYYGPALLDRAVGRTEEE